MNAKYKDYRFNMRAWLSELPKFKRTPALNRIADLSGQTVSTLKRIMYMKHNDESYVRIETKNAICQVLSKNLSELENQNV